MSSILVEVLRDPRQAPGLTPRQFQQLISQARCSALMGSLKNALEQAGTYGQLPRAVKRHLDSGWVVYTKTKLDIEYEVSGLIEALAAAGQRLVLLKGAAYLQANLPPSIGRNLSDIDILAPKASIAAVERSLQAAGWRGAKLDAYNERYYRQWMHEIPPMVHRRRGAVLDLHHTILPPTVAAELNAELLFTQLVEVKPEVYTLSPCDMTIHSAVHLFHEGEFHRGLRDLWDLDQMLRDFSARDTAFWGKLAARAHALDLAGPLFHGLNYSKQVFSTPVPDEVIDRTSSRGRRLRKPLMDFLFLRAFRPDQPECRLPFTGLALYLLYVRSHYLRMPLRLLLPHLTRKAWMARSGKAGTAPEDAAADADR